MNTISTCTAPSSPATHYCFFRLPTRACCWTAAVHAIFQSLQCKQMDPCAWATCVLCLFAQLCLTLCDPMDCGPPGSSVHGDFPGKNTRVGCHALLQGLFPIHGSNLGLLNYGWILYQLSHQGSRRILEWVAYPFSRGLHLGMQLWSLFLSSRHRNQI